MTDTATRKKVPYTETTWRDAARSHLWVGSSLQLIDEIQLRTASGLGPFTVGRQGMQVNLAHIRLLGTGTPDSPHLVQVSARHPRHGYTETHRFNVPLEYVWNARLGYYDATTEVDDPSAVARKLGQKPEDTDELAYIGIDHPGIQWLWDDLGVYATNSGYCGTYDKLVEDLGIPGRKREFRVTFKLGPAEFSGKISARSQAEADEQFKRETLAAFKEAMAE